MKSGRKSASISRVRPRTTDDGDPAPERHEHLTSVTVDSCEHEWARVVVVLPLGDDVGLTLLEAAEIIGSAVLAGLGAEAHEAYSRSTGRGIAEALPAPGAVAVGLDSSGSLH